MNMAELTCLDCAVKGREQVMLEVPEKFMTGVDSVRKYFDMSILLSIEIAKRDNSSITVYLCPQPECGAQTCILGMEEQEEEE